MKEAFRAIEDHELGDDGVRGTGGAVYITANKFRYPLAERAIAAGVQMELPLHRDDLNREDQEGVGYYCYNIRRGRRQSAAVAFIDPVRSRRNLTIMTGANVDRICFEGKRATGVEVRTAGERRIISGHAVILCCGTINSPQLLQMSGIGPAWLLSGLGIEVVHDSADVGRRILEHLDLIMTYRLAGDRGINHRLYGFGLVRSIARYSLTRSGPLANGAMEVGAFVRTDPLQPTPNAQLYVSGWTLQIPDDRSVVAPMQSVQRIAGDDCDRAVASPDQRGNDCRHRGNPRCAAGDRAELADHGRGPQSGNRFAALCSPLRRPARPGGRRCRGDQSRRSGRE